MDYRFWRKFVHPSLFVALVRSPQQAVYFRLRQSGPDQWVGAVDGLGPVPDPADGWEPGLPEYLVPHVCAIRWTWDQVALVNGWDQDTLRLSQLEARCNHWGPEMFLPLDLYEVLQEPYVDIVGMPPDEEDMVFYDDLEEA